jgi:hypothetical protein
MSKPFPILITFLKVVTGNLHRHEGAIHPAFFARHQPGEILPSFGQRQGFFFWHGSNFAGSFKLVSARGAAL